MRKPRSNPLQIKMKANSLPKSVYPKKYFERLLLSIDSGNALPPSWDVELSWRNPATKAGRTSEWQSGEFREVLDESNGGFVGIVRGMLQKRYLARKMNVKHAKISKHRKKTQKGSNARKTRK